MRQVEPSRAFISAKTWAERWDCSISSVRRAARRFAIRRVYVGRGRNGLVRYALEDILRIEAEHEAGRMGCGSGLTIDK